MEEFDLVGNRVYRKSKYDKWFYHDGAKVDESLQDIVSNAYRRKWAMQAKVSTKPEVEYEDRDVTNVVEDGGVDPTTDEDDGNVHDLTSSEARQRFQYDDLLGLVTILLDRLLEETGKDMIIIPESDLVRVAEQKPRVYAEELQKAWKMAMTGYEPPEAPELDDTTQRVRKGGAGAGRHRG